jgi:hypothetical protein
MTEVQQCARISSQIYAVCFQGQLPRCQHQEPTIQNDPPEILLAEQAL